MSEHVPVIIVGGGISGIKAAVDLKANKIESLILEGRDRVGGRAYTYESAVTGTKYDIGASWFHEAGFNPIFKNSLALGNVSYVFDDSSLLLIGPEGDVPFTYKLGQVVDEMKLYASKKKDESVNLHTYANQYILEHKEVLSPEQIRYAPQLLRTTEIMAGSWDTSNGVKASGLYAGRDAFVVSTYESVLNNEMLSLDKDQIKTGVTVKSISKDSKITVTTEDGTKYTCDYCIVTIPQSVLTLPSTEKAAIEFTPKLPDYITSEYPKLATNSLAKVVFEFDKCFWNKSTEKFIFIGEPDEEFAKKVLSNESDVDPVVATAEFNKPASKAPKAWEFPFLCVNLQSIKNVPSLVCLVPAPASIYLERAESAEVWEIFKPMLSKLGEIPDTPVNVFTTNWNDDPYSRGAVSSIKPNGVLVNDGFVKGWDNLRFAGEHTVYEAHGHTHGAWLSGAREAEFIVKDSTK